MPENTAFHGGGFWDWLSPEGRHLDDRTRIINADVLDAWFPPSPKVIETLRALGEWTYRTSPPTHADGLELQIAEARNIPPESILAGPGSSALMYLAWTRWYSGNPPRALILEPTYSEYAHLTNHVLSGEIVRLSLTGDYQWDNEGWDRAINDSEPDISVAVNPNNPTGTTVPDSLFTNHRRSARLWIDEAYLEYTTSLSAERGAAVTPGVFVLKSMSKVYGLSGLRVAYLVGHPDEIRALRAWAPPWWVSLPGQLAAIEALRDSDYYAERYEQTHVLRRALENRLRKLPIVLLASAANWILIRLPHRLKADCVCADLAARGIFIRDAGLTGPSLGSNCVRIAVRPEFEQVRIVQALAEAFCRHL